jgi:hypothetical protein
MHHVQLSEQLYRLARQRASEAGFQSVDDYVAEIVESEVSAATANLDHFFTPEILAELDQIHAAVQAGAKTYTAEEVDEHFRRNASAKRREG